MEEWTGEVREVVLEYGGSAALVNEAAKGNTKARSKGSKRKKQTTSDEESEADGSC